MKNILFAIKIIFFILFGFSSCSGEDKSSINTNDFGNIYNELIRDGLKVHSSISERSCFTLCGTPEEYEEALNTSLKEL